MIINGIHSAKNLIPNTQSVIQPMVTWSQIMWLILLSSHPRNESYSKMMHMQKIQFTYFRKIDFIFVKNARNLREGQIQRSRSHDLTWPWNKPKSCFQCFWLIKTAGTDSEKKRFLLSIAFCKKAFGNKRWLR